MKSNTIFTAKPKTNEQEDALKAFMQALNIEFEVSNEEDGYTDDFVAEIEESREQYKKGDFVSVEKKDIKRFLDLD